MKKILPSFFIIFLFLGMYSYAFANFPIEYTGVAYWGKTSSNHQTPSIFGISAPTTLTEGVVEDVLGKYLTQNNSIGYWNTIPQVAYCIKYTEPDAGGNFYCRYYEYHWAIRRTIYCYAPLIPDATYRHCISQPEPAIPPTAKMNGDACDSLSKVGGN